MVQFILDFCGVDVDEYTDGDGVISNSLHIASRMGHLSIVKLLMALAPCLFATLTNSPTLGGAAAASLLSPGPLPLVAVTLAGTNGASATSPSGADTRLYVTNNGPSRFKALLLFLG